MVRGRSAFGPSDFGTEGGSAPATSTPVMPYASWPGRWHTYVSVPAAFSTIVVRRVSPAGIVTSVGRAPWTGSVPVRCRSWTAASPRIHSWSIGSSFRSTIVTGTPTGTESCDGSKCE